MNHYNTYEDRWIRKYLADGYEEFREYLKERGYESNFRTFRKYDRGGWEDLMNIIKEEDEEEYEYLMNNIIKEEDDN